MATLQFGGVLIFDGFPSMDEAEGFAEWAGDTFGRATSVTTFAATVNEREKFPYTLDPPVVTVRRDENWTREDEIEAGVATFGGRFAGT